ncbi:MAG TPA: hypothetical protein VF274_05065 [Alphaproteobacteria bacterium]|jgi:hypothetical protein
MSRHLRTAVLAGLALAPVVIAVLAACNDGPAPPPAMAPAGSTPEQIRFFCTQESERAAASVGFPPDYVAARQRAANAAFADCMARHNIRP